MWFYTIVLIAALVGLLTLFVLKLFEERGRRIAVLMQLRERWDAPIAERVERVSIFVTQDAPALAKRVLRLCRTKAIAAEVAILSLSHRAAAGLHERLLHRKKHLAENGGAVSPHLKDVLEYTKEATAPKE